MIRAAAVRAAPVEVPSGGRQKLMQAAALAFMERGYSGTSIDDVAAVIGVTKGAVYHHFSSKADLYFAVQEGAMQRIDDMVRPIFGSGLAPDARVHGMARAHLGALIDDFAAAKVAVQGLERSLMKAMGVAERRQLRRLVRMRDAYEQMFVATIADGSRAGLFVNEPPSLLAKAMLGALNWSTLWFDPSRTRSHAAREEVIVSLSCFALRGLGNTNSTFHQTGPLADNT